MKIASARVARGTSVENDCIPMAPNEIAFISSDDGYSPSGDIRAGGDPCFPLSIGGQHAFVAENFNAPAMKVYHHSTFADGHNETEQSQAPAPALAANGIPFCEANKFLRRARPSIQHGQVVGQKDRNEAVDPNRLQSCTRCTHRQKHDHHS